MKAYVLLRTQLMETSHVVETLRRMKDVISADVTFGPYDVVAQVQANDLETMSRIVIQEIRTLPGVLDTLTCLAVQEAS